MALRPYQKEALAAVKKRTTNRGIVALATGCGKGHIAGDLMDSLGTEKVLYLAHREELISQLAGHVERRIGFMNVDIEQAGNIAGGARSVVASVPTLAASDCRRLKRLGSDRFEAIIVDEAHHATAESYLKIWQYFGILGENKKKVDTPHIPLIGLTATPSRGDGVGLNNVFDEILYQYSLTQAINDGWLCPVYAWTVKTGVSLDGIKTRMGDYSEKELHERCATDERNAVIFKAHSDYAADKKTLIFCIDIEHSEQLAEWFSDHGRPANFVSGKMSSDERASMLRWFTKTPGAVLTNCQLITEGVDIPGIECVIMARPTKSRTLYAQMIGRGTRLARGAADIAQSVKLGKDRVVLLDITDSTKDLGRRAVNIADIFGAPIPLKPMAGENVVKEAEKQEAILEAVKHGGRLPDGTEYVAAAFDLFASPADIDGAEMAWLDYGDTYRLQLAKYGEITVQSDALDRWAALYYNPETNTTVPVCGVQGGGKEAVIKIVEGWVNRYHPDVMRLLDRNAKWRNERPSSQQLELCRRMRLFVPDNATKGQVSMILSRRFGAKKTTAGGCV
jgi:ATP-dependent helicase IRC3